MNVSELDVFNVGASILIGVTDCMDEDELRIRWRDLRNELASEWQMREIDDFERWNFYLFYVVKDKKALDRSLKYTIEHDTISSRKIIVNSSEITDDGIKSLIKSYIKYEIKNDADAQVILGFEKDKSAYKLVGNED